MREREAFVKQVREQSLGEERELEVREGNRQKAEKKTERRMRVKKHTAGL